MPETAPRSLRVAVVQSGGATDDLAANLDGLRELVRAAATPDEDGLLPDLVVLPELCTTPYFCTSHATDRTPWADTVPGRATDVLGSLARELGCALAFGVYERTAQGVFHNAVVVLGSDGVPLPWRNAAGEPVVAYRKLSVPASWLGDVDIDEKYFFAPGQGPATVDLLGTRIGAVVCYDRSFPEYWAVARGLGAEVVLAIVSSLGTREELFVAELRTRALESQTWVVAANRGGPETLNGRTLSYFGLSCVVDPHGALVAQAPAHRTGAVLRATLDLDAVDAVRASFPLGRDRRSDVAALNAALVAGTVVPAPFDRTPTPVPAPA